MSSSTVKEIASRDKSTNNNGFIFNEKYVIPRELVSNILFYYVDRKTLQSCQSVCKQWNDIMKKYVWRKRAKLILNRKIPPLHKDTPWTFYRLLCQKELFNKNLIKNHSGEKCLNSKHFSAEPVALFGINALKVQSKHSGLCSDCDWAIVEKATFGCWGVECPPLGVPPLPDDPVLADGENCCFVTHYHRCEKQQIIDLLKEGFTEYLLDYWQPPIKVSEWFSSRWDCEAFYECRIELITEVEGNDVIFKHINYDKHIIYDDMNQWFKFEHEFKDYGKGLRKIKFYHAGQDVGQMEEDHYGCKMAGACVTLGIPDGLSINMTTATLEEPHPDERNIEPGNRPRYMWNKTAFFLLLSQFVLLIIVLWVGYMTLSKLMEMMFY